MIEIPKYIALRSALWVSLTLKHTTTAGKGIPTKAQNLTPQEKTQHPNHLNKAAGVIEMRKYIALRSALWVSLTLEHPQRREMVKRLDEMEVLPDNEKNMVFHYIDLIIRDFKTKTAYNA